MEKNEQGVVPLLVPDVGDAESIELIEWNIKSGDHVIQGQEICELVTDKAAFPLESPYSGTIQSINKNPGEHVVVGEVIAYLLIDN